MASQRRRMLGVVVVASLVVAGCGTHRTDLAVASAEWDPLKRAIKDAGADPERAEATATVVRTGTQTQPKRSFDPLYVISYPLGFLWNGARHVVLTDIDPKARPTFETRVVYKKRGGPDDSDTMPFKDDEPFDVSVKYVAIDSFTDGRLRDAWGGTGGEVSIQTSLNGLSDRGMLLRDDTKFLVENEVKRRSALLALAKGTAKGREYTKKVEDKAKELLAKVQDLKIDLANITKYVERVQSATADRAGEVANARKEAIAFVDAWVKNHVTGSDAQALATQFAESLVEAVFNEIDSHLDDKDIDQAATWVAKVASAAAKHIEQATALLDFFGRFGVDEQGIYETAKIIVGLADADRLSTIEYENVKPSLLRFAGEATGGTAATLIGDDLDSTGGLIADSQGAADSLKGDERERAIEKVNDDVVVSPRGLVYHGSLSDLSRTMDGVKGISLSFLMLDRGDDRVVRALRALQQYADQRGMTIGGGVSQIEVSSILDGLAVLAQKIADDKVELRSIDVRFMISKPKAGATPGKEVFTLRPCTILVSRNLNGSDFAAVAEISITRSK